MAYELYINNCLSFYMRVCLLLCSWNLCIVCNGPVTEDGVQVVYRGVSRSICTENCEEEWGQSLREDRLDTIVFKVEPPERFFNGFLVARRWCLDCQIVNWKI